MKIFATNERAELLPAFAQTGNRVLEIGVGGSEFSRLILQHLPDAQLTCVDPFSENGGVIPGFYDHNSNEHSARALTEEFGAQGRYRFIKGASPGGLRRIPDNSFDWIFVDGDHTLNGVRKDLRVSDRLVRPGGIIACHDFAVHQRARAYLQEVVAGVMGYAASGAASLYGLDLSVYPTAILIREPSGETAGMLDRALGRFLLHSFRQTPRSGNFAFTQTLAEHDESFTVSHAVSVGDELFGLTTHSTRVFSGYYRTFDRVINASS